MTIPKSIEVTDRHYAIKEAITDALGLLPWPTEVNWFHDFGFIHLAAPNFILRVAISERDSAAARDPSYKALVASLFPIGGCEIVRQEFPFHHYDRANPKTNQLAVVLTLGKKGYQFQQVAETRGNAIASEELQERFEPLCSAIIRWASYHTGVKKVDSHRHERSHTIVDAPPVPTTTIKRQVSTTDDEAFVVIEEPGESGV